MAVFAWLMVPGAPMAASAQADFVTSAQVGFARGLAAYDAGDYRTAFEQWHALAEAGDAEARTALAGLYQAGEGVPEDAAAALHWYRRAAEQGDAVAQQNLGDLYATGRGAARDLVRAYVWLSLAAEQGRSWAARRRDGLSPQLSPEQHAEAEARIEAWRKVR